MRQLCPPGWNHKDIFFKNSAQKLICALLGCQQQSQDMNTNTAKLQAAF